MNTKRLRILEVLSTRSLNRFEAERYGDHCLNSTIAALRAGGIEIHDTWECVTTRFRPTRVKRYFLMGAQR